MLFPNDFQRLSTNQIKNKSSLSLIIHILSVKLFVLFCGIIVLMRFLVTELVDYFDWFVFAHCIVVFVSCVY